MWTTWLRSRVDLLLSSFALTSGLLLFVLLCVTTPLLLSQIPSREIALRLEISDRRRNGTRFCLLQNIDHVIVLPRQTTNDLIQKLLRNFATFTHFHGEEICPYIITIMLKFSLIC